MKILIVDEHPMLQDGLELLLRQLDPGVEVARARNLKGLELDQDAMPDLILCDIAASDETVEEGMAALDALHGRIPDIPLIVISATRDRTVISGALEAGARGYILKTYGGDLILSAIRLVLSGGVYVPPELFETITGGPAEDASSPILRSGKPKLTPRQHDVLILLARGCSNRDIARTLGVAEGTIKIHVAAIFKALNVSNRTQAAIEAARFGLLDRNDAPETFGA
jgi:DNA-binding NarL/FixJ family response regulator